MIFGQVFEVAVVLEHPRAGHLIHDQLVEERAPATRYMDVDEMIGDDHFRTWHMAM